MTEEEEKQNDRLLEGLKKEALRLHEHFDTVQILATRFHNDGTTSAFEVGRGNWYARQGQARTWITQDDENTREQVRRKGEEV